jgi:hypothetical protein
VKKIAVVSIIVIFYFFLYWSSIQNFFFQDDFLLLDISRANNLKELLKFFQPISGFPYRPLATHGFYFLLQSIFGVNSIIFHLITLFWLLINGLLIFKILNTIFKKKNVAIIGLFFYLTSPIHYMTLFWVATFYFAQGATFFFLSFYSFLKFLKSYEKTYLFVSLAAYILGSLSNETVLVLPLLLLIYVLLERRTLTKAVKGLKTILPYFLVGGFLIFFRLHYAGLPEADDYALSLNFSFFRTLQWYTLRSFGLPEGIRFMNNRVLITVIFMIFISFLGLNRLLLKKFRLDKRDLNKIILGISWFVLGALPFYFLPKHLSSYYLEIAILGMIIIWLTWLSPIFLNTKKVKVLIILLTITSYGLLSLISIRSMQDTHWVSTRGKTAFKLVSKLIEKCRLTPEGEAVYLAVSEGITEARVVFYENHAQNIFCAGRNVILTNSSNI